ncbi:hypothetical protein D3C81_2226930 [compost metagenome]
MWPRRENRAAAEDQPDLVAFPYRADAIDDDPSFQIGAADERQQDTAAQVKTIGQGKAHQQDADQAPPDQAQSVIV